MVTNIHVPAGRQLRRRGACVQTPRGRASVLASLTSPAVIRAAMSVICWFRKGLRVHDNPALSRAVEVAKAKGIAVFPLFIIDPHFGPGKVGILRYNFLLESLADLDASLRRLGSRLHVARGKPGDVIPRLLKRWGTSLLTFEADSEPYAKRRDASVVKLAEEAGVAVEQFHSHTLRELDFYLRQNRGAVPASYGAFCKLHDRMPPVPPCAPDIDTVPGGDAAADIESAAAAMSDDATDKMDKNFSIPTLAEMGYPSTVEAPYKVLYRGGESAALERLRASLAKGDWVRAFEKPNTSPNALEPSTTVLSPYIKFGCLSARRFYHELAAVYAKGKHSKPPVSLHGQLLWREYFYLNGHAVPNFDRMEGNPICRFIPWGDDPDRLTAWKEGRTGYPFIDAVMTQLRTEGWIHHLARHAVACFLTRGDLWQHWEAGAAVFDELLLDADWSLNSANWMWLSASAFFHQYFRVYSPIAFGKKTDPEGLYIKKYLPVLRKMPKKYIFEPWSAPLEVQRGCGCIIGKDYPKPIVDHRIASEANMARMKEAYDAHKSGAAATDNDARPAKKSRAD